MHTAMRPTSVEQKVAMSMGRKTSDGLAAPIWARYTMTPRGTMVSPVVLSTRNMIMGLLAVSLRGLISCISFMAFSPSGVAALSSPNILADIFIKIEPKAGWFFGRSGNNRVNRGLIQREKVAMTPPRSPIFINPSHKDKTPVNPRDISKAVLAEENVEFMISLQMSRLP